MTESLILELRDLSFQIGRKTVLDRVSLRVHRGQHVIVIGPNGAGKTTLLKCLMRIYRQPSNGIRVDGRPIESYSQKSLARLMSYVPQANGQALDFTALEFVAMGRYPYLSPFAGLGERDKSAIARALALTGTGSMAGQPLKSLSGGERQRVYIAAGLAQGAKILLLDEPTAFLDPLQQANVHNVLATLNHTLNLTIFSVTHDINSAALWGDRIVGLKAGRVTFCGTAAELMDNRVLLDIYDKQFEFAEHPTTGARIVVPDGRSH